jgi:hypothetical protein
MSAVGCWLSDKAEVVKSAGLALRYTAYDIVELIDFTRTFNFLNSVCNSLAC